MVIHPSNLPYQDCHQTNQSNSILCTWIQWLVFLSRVNFKIQINVPLKQNSQLNLLCKEPNLIFQVVCFDHFGDVVIDNRTDFRLKSVPLTPIIILNAVIWCVAIMFAARVIQTDWKHKIQNKHYLLVSVKIIVSVHTTVIRNKS